VVAGRTRSIAAGSLPAPLRRLRAARGEATVDREGAGDVGGIALQLATRIDQQQVAVGEWLVVLR